MTSDELQEVRQSCNQIVRFDAMDSQTRDREGYRVHLRFHSPDGDYFDGGLWTEYPVIARAYITAAHAMASEHAAQMATPENGGEVADA